MYHRQSPILFLHKYLRTTSRGTSWLFQANYQQKKHCAFLGRKSWILETPGLRWETNFRTICWSEDSKLSGSTRNGSWKTQCHSQIRSLAGTADHPGCGLSASRKRDYCKTNSNNQQHTQPTTHITSIISYLQCFFLIPKLVALNRLVWTLDLQHLALWEAITRSPRLWSTGAWIQWASSLHHFHWPGGSQRGGFRDDNLPALSSSIGYFRLIYAVLNCIKWINIDQKKL